MAGHRVRIERRRIVPANSGVLVAEFFDIPSKNLSSSNWAAAISHFNQTRREIYPSRMLDALLSCAKVRLASEQLRCVSHDRLRPLNVCTMLSQSIYSTHKREHVSAVGEGEARTLAGDEILPILCYIISHADVICLGVLVEMMMGVCDPLVLNGESGYYLTVLGASLSVSPLE